MRYIKHNNNLICTANGDNIAKDVCRWIHDTKCISMEINDSAVQINLLKLISTLLD